MRCFLAAMTRRQIWEQLKAGKSPEQVKRELTKAYGELGETAFRLADAGAISNPELAPQVDRIRELLSKLEEPVSAA